MYQFVSGWLSAFAFCLALLLSLFPAFASAGPVNQPPAANGQTLSLDEDKPVKITLTGSDPEKATLKYIITRLPAHGSLKEGKNAIAIGAALKKAQLNYTPTLNYFGSDSFTFKVNDGVVDSPEATVTLDIKPVNDSPVPLAQSVSVDEDSSIVITPTAADPESISLTYIINKQPQKGTLEDQKNGTYRYTPAPNYAGKDSFTFQAKDNEFTSKETATIDITVNPVNDTPVANPQRVSLDEDKTATIQLTGSDPESSSLTYKLVKQPSQGSWVDKGKGKFTYTPTANYAGEDSFTFTVTDNELTSSPATVSLTVKPVNDPPVASAMTLTVSKPTNITLSAQDPDSNALTYSIEASPKNGSLGALVSGNVVTYTPKSGFSGKDSFSFKVSDGALTSAPAKVELTVNTPPPNQTPTANAGSDQTVNEQATVQLDGSASSDPDGSIVSYKWTQPTGESVTLTDKDTAKPSFTAPVVSNTAASKTLGFLLEVTDDKGAVATDRVFITVNAVNANPTADAGVDQTVVGGSTVSLLGRGSDPDTDALTYQWQQTAGTPLVTLKDGNTATAAFTAPVVTADTTLTFTLTVTDGNGGTATDSVAVHVQSQSGPVVQPSPTGKLNDTGITLCGDYAFGNSGKHNNNVDCALLTDADGDPVPRGQDGHHGRDVANGGGTNNHAGSTLIRLGANGQPLTIQDAAWSDTGSEAAGTRWSCVKDTTTGLVWEAKGNSGLHSAASVFTWYEPDASKNGGDPGVKNGPDGCEGLSECNTYRLAQATNAEGLCGMTSWRMPTLTELRSIADLANNPPLDTAYESWFWSGETDPADASRAWSVYWGNAGSRKDPRGTPYRARLVSAVQEDKPGFSFTKIGADGRALAIQDGTWAANGSEAAGSQWSCVKDNVTGLIWEVKTNDGGLHDKDWTYTWYDTNTATNGGLVGIRNGGNCDGTSQCDTSSYVAAVNTAGWCGASNGWRMPTLEELQSIADLSRSLPAIDTAYFPNTNSNVYWSGTSYGVFGYSAYARDVRFDVGAGGWTSHGSEVHVRLVRSGQ